ncbi:S41 family peptidase [Pyxidicoccus sp. MSG2]|uniref:S41 family peptidase n=1 Tax=Pyxidicoccus sp. MSG2 TaxID=2996790 RepID=UPI00226EB4C1|nr:S41 family peptidase [Pyxidicoccus sp. MSG2]MCY1014666.1 S41 family peptidase [Pyxidicoccus sp. MSG2]
MLFPTLVIGLSLTATNPWAQMAEQDLKAMRQAILENHPGPVDPLNPSFKQWLDGGYRQALTRARQARSFGGYDFAIRYYAAGFRDGHLRAGAYVAPLRASWPGFILSLRQGRYVVASVDDKDPAQDTLPAVGSELLDCDGRAAQKMLEQDVLPFAAGADIESLRMKITPSLLQDVGNPEVKPPSQCRVKTGTEVRTVALRYRPIPTEEHEKKLQAAAFGPTPSFGTHTFGKAGVWVSIPTFGPREGSADFEAMRSLAEQAGSWRSAEVLVFDVRGNTGGNSAWGKQLAQGLFGEELVKARSEDDPKARAVYVDWRASADNVRYLGEMTAQLGRQFGKDSREEKWAGAVTQGLTEARRRGQPLWSEKEEASSTPPATEPANPVRTRVYLLTDGRCGSACLDFADLMLSLPGVTHVGLPTSADSVYMEVRVVDLPSGTTRIIVPIKVYRNRPRGHNEPYVPARRFDGDIGDTAAVEHWLLEQDAARASAN